MIKINAIGDNCPIPVVKAKKAMQEIQKEEILQVSVDNEIAVQNLMKMAKSQGAEASFEKIEENRYEVSIHVLGNQNSGETAKEETEKPQRQKDNVVLVISSDRMGSGNDDLGKVLIKGFLFAVTQLEKLPKTILFYNGGAVLTTEGSDSLEDLQYLEEQGVEILTCGTCLNYYGLTDKLKVGDVTNMYTIVEKMAEADKLLQP